MPSRLTLDLMSLLLTTPAVIFSLGLVIQPATVANQCPQECSCDAAGYHVKCYGSSMTSVPLINHTHVQTLELYNNNITLFERDCFVLLTELQVLILLQCGLRSIELGAFNGLTKLRDLCLEGNEISEILPGTFENLISLEKLELKNNNLKHLDRNMFSGLFNLVYINIYGNKLKYINPDTFLQLPRIRCVIISKNPGLQVQTDRNFIKSNSLSHLHISHCNVSSLSFETFANASALELLDIGYNNLRTVDINILTALPKLSTLLLHGNPLQCDCRLLEVWRWCEDRNIVTVNWRELPKCDTPSEVEGMWWAVLEKGQCLDGNIRYDGDFKNTSYIYKNNKGSYRETEAETCMDIVKDTENFTEKNVVNYTPTNTDYYRETDTYTNNYTETYTENYRGTDGAMDERTEMDTDMNTGILTDTDYYVETDEDVDEETETDTDKDTETKTDTDMDTNILAQYQVPIYAVPYIVGTTGNVILLIIIICNKNMRTVPNMYILNLAISDIIYLTVLFSEAYANKISDKWLEGEFMCMFVPFCRRLSVGLSAYSVAVLSIQRYRVTVNPIQVRVSSQPTWCVTVAAICGVWIVAALFAVPSVLSKFVCEELQNVRSLTYYKRVVIFELLVSCVFPLCVIAFTYVMMARYLFENSRSISEGTQIPQLQTRRNTAKIVVGLTVVFVISYVPYHAFWTYIICTEEKENYHEKFTNIVQKSNNKLQNVYLISTCFLLINSCLNPVALFCTSSPFRQHLKRYLTCVCKTNSPSNDLELTRRN